MRYRLKLKRLDFVSPVDDPAQETAKVLLIKRAEVDGVANVVKISDELGLVFCWAFTSKAGGVDYYDLHGDVIDEDFIRAAAEFMERGGPTDEMHDQSPDGRVVFAMPMTPDIAKAFGVQTDTVGLMVALKPSPEVLAKFKTGEYTGVSIQGMGERVEARKHEQQLADALKRIGRLEETMMKAETMPCPACGAEIPADATTCPECGADLTAKSTPADPVKHADPMIIVLSEAQHAHYQTLKGADAEAFVAKSADERDAVIAEIAKSNAIVYKSEDGTEYRHSDDARLVDMAKKLDESVRVAKAEAAAREQIEIEKRAESVFGKVAGERALHAKILKAVEALGDDALRSLQSMANLANERMASLELVAGVKPEADAPVTDNPQSEYDAMVSEAAKSFGGDRFKAAASVLKTKRGMDLYAAIETQKRAKARK